jgi:hypothetical protein
MEYVNIMMDKCWECGGKAKWILTFYNVKKGYHLTNVNFCGRDCIEKFETHNKNVLTRTHTKHLIN